MRLKNITLDKTITYLRWPVVIFGVIYLSCMIAVPLFMGDWRDVQEVWDRWQGFNVGVLAFGASFIAFEITRYNESRQRKRDFLAARAFLPEALSELTTYLNGSAAVLMTAWNGTPQVAIPPVPLQYRDVFSNCIRHADSSTGEKLADILVWLQVHTARLQLFLANPAHTQAMMRINVLENLRLVGELQAKVNRMFGFARGMDELDSGPLEWEDYKTAYANLGLNMQNLVVGKFSLESLTKAHIEKSNR